MFGEGVNNIWLHPTRCNYEVIKVLESSVELNKMYEFSL
jgi:hypothetical protein